MPRIKVERILSVNSEDAQHPAENILSTETNKKWKCKTPGEKNCMVILQLSELTKITGLDIGNEHSAFVEVLVGRTGFNDDQYQQLLMTSSFMTPRGSAQSESPNRIRMFNTTDFCQNVVDERWDRIKIICTQPFNRHVQYGLSFVTLHSTNAPTAPKVEPPKTPATNKIGKFAIRTDDTGDIAVGSAFSRLKQNAGTNSPTTAAQEIRKASLPTYITRNGSPSINKLDLNTSKTPSTSKTPTNQASKNRNQLLYDDEDDVPSNRVNRAIKNFENSKKKEEKSNTSDSEESTKKKTPTTNPKNGESSERKKKTPVKRKSVDSNENIPVKRLKKLKTRPFKELMKGVVFVMSGYQNPLRADIRNKALQMGAKYKPDWGDGCTHLICAFRNTPKYNDVFGLGKIMSANWISECHNQKKLLSWRPFALDRDDKNGSASEEEIIADEIAPTSDDLATPSTSTKPPILQDSGEDTEDEIERVQQSKKITKNKSPEKVKKTPVNKFVLSDSDDDEEQDKNTPIKSPVKSPNQNKENEENGVSGNQSIYDQDTDLEDNYEKDENVKIKALPRLFDGKMFWLSDSLPENEVNLLKRYITAYAGSISQIQNEADFIITKSYNADEIQKGTKVVHPAWIWECHDSESLLPIEKFIIQLKDANGDVSDEYD